MEITSFILGMLTIVAVIILTVIVVGMVKINKLEKQQEYLNSSLERTRSELYDAMKDDYNNIWRQFENTGRDVTMIEKTIMNRIDQTRQEWDRAIDEAHRAMVDLSNLDRSYIDSRIDKVVAKGTFEGSKQVIKG
jgi:outer membrane murein-binding lipoprotein Lpp